MNLFEQLGLDEPILRAIIDMGFETPSEIQQKAIPTLLEDDTDMVALAQTGTGKTAALASLFCSLSILIASLHKGLSFRLRANFVCKLLQN